METIQDKLVEVMPNKLYWISDIKEPKGIPNAFYFCVDKDLKYMPFFSDFGPLNIAQVYKFVTELEKLLQSPSTQNIKIFHYTDMVSANRVNAAFIMGCFMVSLKDSEAKYELRTGLGKI